MIITHISADNLLKYKHLEFEKLPRKGCITISGQNESGKSTIGETVCFALFGRTFSLADDKINCVIRWGEARCSVRLGFSVAGLDYEIARFLDNEGNHGARLYLAGEEDHPIAKGVTAVNNAIYELLGYQFEEFVESFYLAQREITTPHPHSHAIKTMAGIAPIERVADELEFEVKYEKSRISELCEQLENTEDDIKSLAIEPGKTEELASQLEIIQRAGKDLHEREQGLTRAASDYSVARGKIRSAQIVKSISGLLGFVFLLATLATATFWYLFNKLPESPYTAQLSAWLEQTIPGWSEQSAIFIPQLIPATVVLFIIFLLLWLLSHARKKKIATLQENGGVLAVQLLFAQEPVTGLADENITPLSDNVENEASQVEPESPAPTDAPANDNISTISIRSSELSAIRRCKLELERTNTLVEDRQHLLQHRARVQQEIQQALEFSICEEQDRHDKAASLNRVLGNLQEKLAEHTHRVQVREMADELTSAAGRHFSHRFNKDLRELASRTLPLFTEGRYEHLHIDNDLNVRAFSSLKHDYMDLDEISSGTQRQIMLAVRLALSQELVNTTNGGEQFIFLDEPFVLFDETRTRNAMAILPELSEEIRQIWVIAQSFPEDTQRDLDIVCSRANDSLPPQESEA